MNDDDDVDFGDYYNDFEVESPSERCREMLGNLTYAVTYDELSDEQLVVLADALQNIIDDLEL